MLGGFHAGVYLGDFAFWINDERVSRGEFAPFVIHHRSVFSRDFGIRIGKQFEIEPFLRAKILVRLRSVDAHAKDHCVRLLILGEVALEIAGFQRATARTEIVHVDMTADLTSMVKLPSTETGLAFNVGAV